MGLHSNPAPSLRARVAQSLLVSQPRSIVRSGRVIHGNKLGRELGIPTANIALRDEYELRFGIYATVVEHDGRQLAGAASWGTRPHFDDGAPLLEVHLLDFSGDLYDQQLKVQFIDFIRPEKAFKSLNAMMREIRRDIAKTRSLTAAWLSPRHSRSRPVTFDTDHGQLPEMGLFA